MIGAGVLGIIISLILIIYLSWKGFSILVVGPLCAVVIILFNQMDLMSYLLNDPAKSYFWSMSSFIAKFLPIFLLGAILGKYMEDSGAANVIATFIIHKIGKESPFSMLVAIAVIGAVITYGGINAFVAMFAIIPLARPLFKEMDVPWHLIILPLVLGTGSFTMTMLPGSPSVQNVIPTAVLGTSLTAGAGLGVFASIVTITFYLLYMRYALNLAKSSGDGYVSTSADNVNTDKKNLPSTGKSILPIVLVLSILLPGSIMKIPNIIYIGLLIGIFASMLLYHRNIASHAKTLNTGATNAIIPAILTGATVGFGMIMIHSPAFSGVSKAIMGIQNPLIGLSTMVYVFSGITGSPTAALGIIMPAYGTQFLQMGLNPELIHRISTIAGTAMAGVPFGGGVIAVLTVTGLTHKQAYKHMVITSCIFGTVTLILSLIMASILY